MTSRFTRSMAGAGGSADGVGRRDFLKTAGIAGAGFMVVGRQVLGGAGFKAPGEKLNIAGIGVGGMGFANLKECEGENIVALCDVDDVYAAKAFARYPKARRHRDFRRMLEVQKDIDAVVIATPDHTHAVIALAAMSLGKHVYVQKPLARTIGETRLLSAAARRYKVATQMGNQGHSMEGIRLIKEWIDAGAIGPVREVHCWTDRPMGWWPQGVERPRETPAPPATLDWDLWLGPAPARPYHPAYHPFKWRGWWDFGTGALGDMGCHLFDAPFWALDLGYPTSIEATSTPVNGETAPLGSMVHYRFPARGVHPPVTLTWYEGGLRPPRPVELEDDRPLGSKNGGLLLVGDTGKIMASEENARNPRLLPETAMAAFRQPPRTIPRIHGSHEQDWIRACKGGPPAGSNFDYAAPLTEVVLLGNLALRTGKKLYWDGPNLRVTNVPEANAFVRAEARAGWGS